MADVTTPDRTSMNRCALQHDHRPLPRHYRQRAAFMPRSRHVLPELAGPDAIGVKLVDMRRSRCDCGQGLCHCVMAGLAPTTHDFAPSSTASRGWPAQGGAFAILAPMGPAPTMTSNGRCLGIVFSW